MLGALGRLRDHGWKIGIVGNGAPTQETKVYAAGLRKNKGYMASGTSPSAKPSFGPLTRLIAQGSLSLFPATEGD